LISRDLLFKTMEKSSSVQFLNDDDCQVSEQEQSEIDEALKSI